MDNNLNIKLYVHGVPYGHSTWGVESSDNIYIDTFYSGGKFSVSVQMCVEVRQLPGGQSYSYYTYMRTDNITDYAGRQGSFFALTLRINYYYADIQNIYNILDAAYNKFIVGTIVDVRSKTKQYKIKDFAEAGNTLSSLGKELDNYLRQFSSYNDLITLQSFRRNNQNLVMFNLPECDAKTILDYVRNGSIISVSPLYESARERKRIQETDAKISSIEDQAQRQINETKQNAQREISATKSQAQQQVNEARQEKESEIQKIRNQYKNTDKTIQALERNLEQEKKESERLGEKVSRLTNDLKKIKAELEKNKTAETTNKIYKKAFNEIHDILQKLNVQQVDTSSISQKTEARNNNKGGVSPKQEEKRHISSAKIIHTVYRVIKILIELLLAVLIIISLCKRESPKVQYTRHSENNIKLNPKVPSKVAISNTAADKTVTSKKQLS